MKIIYDFLANHLLLSTVTIQICKTVDFLIDNFFVRFGGSIYCQVIGIPKGTNCAPLLADLFLYSYESDFLDNLIQSGHRRLARSFKAVGYLCHSALKQILAAHCSVFHMSNLHFLFLVRVESVSYTWEKFRFYRILQ